MHLHRLQDARLFPIMSLKRGVVWGGDGHGTFARDRDPEEASARRSRIIRSPRQQTPAQDAELDNHCRNMTKPSLRARIDHASAYRNVIIENRRARPRRAGQSTCNIYRVVTTNDERKHRKKGILKLGEYDKSIHALRPTIPIGATCQREIAQDSRSAPQGISVGSR